jgi:hypothetical protein
VEPITPELVLVDPELARRARALLPDLRESNGNVTLALPDVIAVARPLGGADAVAFRDPPTVRPPVVRAREAAAAELEAEVAPRPALGHKVRLVAAGSFIFLLGVLTSRILAGGDPVPSTQLWNSGVGQPESGLPRSPPRVSSSLRGTSRISATQSEDVRAGRVEVGGRQSPKRPGKPRPRKAPLPRGASSLQSSPGEAARVGTHGGVAKRLFVWLPSRGAHYYHVQFLKGTRTFFEAWPTDPRVTVPLRGTFRGRQFAFTNGRYRWIVRPAFGARSNGRYGEPIVRSIWVVRR